MTEQKIIKSQRKSKIKIGDEFTRLEVVGKAGKAKNGNIKWHCICACGKKRIVTGGNLNSGHTKSCGCLKRELVTKHGMSQSSTYIAWRGMLQRCTNSNRDRYKDWGGRGIIVCDRWKTFTNFLLDMGEKPKGLTLERLDNDGNYEPSNCRWVTYVIQSRNQRLRKDNTTGNRGITNKTKKYRVTIEANNKRYHIGYFKNIEDAKAARLAAEKKYWT